MNYFFRRPQASKRENKGVSFYHIPPFSLVITGFSWRVYLLADGDIIVEEFPPSAHFRRAHAESGELVCRRRAAGGLRSAFQPVSDS